mmetsp:Transcript_11115/g.20923  ORF Transcript_11115/g.20923 Transcript_11115/m.20923 type:complete len:319 (+) Transcript_11115:675-1631(+)
MLRNHKPELLPQDLILLRSIGHTFRQLQIDVERVVDGLFVKMHHAVQLHAAPDLLQLHAEAQGKLGVVVRVPRGGKTFHREVLEERSLVFVLAQEGKQQVVYPAILVLHPAYAIVQVPQRLLGVDGVLPLVPNLQQGGQELDGVEEVVGNHPRVHRGMRLQQKELWGGLVPQVAAHTWLPENLDRLLGPVPLDQVLNDRLVILYQARVVDQLVYVTVAREEPRGRRLVQVFRAALQKLPKVAQGLLVPVRVLPVLHVRFVDGVEVYFGQPRRKHRGLSLLRGRHLPQPLLKERLEPGELVDLDEFQADFFEGRLAAHV